MTATINNNTVSMNVQDTLPVLLRMLDAEEMAHYECMTPTTLDTLSSYRDAVEPLPYLLENYGVGDRKRRVGKECLRLCRSRWSPYH